jgi:glycosyltransferase involved in cell wall biosynthesis
MKILMASLSDGLIDTRPRRVASILRENCHLVTQIGFQSSEKEQRIYKNFEYVPIPYYSRQRNFMPYLSIYIEKIVDYLIYNFFPHEYKEERITNKYVSPMFQKQFEYFLEGKDMVYVQDLVLLPMAIKIAEQVDIPVIYEAREFYEHQYSHKLFWRMTEKKGVLSCEKRNLHKVNRVITVSQGIANSLEHKYHLQAKPHVFLGFPEYSKFAETSHIKKNRFEILFHGNLSKDRGLLGFFKVLKTLDPKYSLLIRGKSSQAFLDQLFKGANKIGIESFKVVDAVDYENLFSVASCSGYGLIPWSNRSLQKKYSMPNKYFEYLVSGLPIICTSGSEISEHVIKYNLGVVYDERRRNLGKILDSITVHDYDSFVSSIIVYLKENGFHIQKERFLNLIENVH